MLRLQVGQRVVVDFTKLSSDHKEAIEAIEAATWDQPKEGTFKGYSVGSWYLVEFDDGSSGEYPPYAVSKRGEGHD